jgi:hypothetical protein
MAVAVPQHGTCGKGACDSMAAWTDDALTQVLTGGTAMVYAEVDGDG